jgi:hypothetical protein
LKPSEKMDTTILSFNLWFAFNHITPKMQAGTEGQKSSRMNFPPKETLPSIYDTCTYVHTKDI